MNYGLSQWIILGVVLIPSVFWDIRYKKISILPVISGIVLGLVFSVFRKEKHLVDMVISLLPGLFLLAASFVSKGCIGSGDGFICVFLGCVLPFKYVIYATVTGFMLAAVFGLVLILLKKAGRKTKLPFIPFLSAGVFLWGLV